MTKEQNILVIDKNGRRLNNCSYKRARKLVGRGSACWVGKDTIKLKVNKEDRKRLRARIISNADSTCYICNYKILNEPPTLDHVTPKSYWGKDTLSNLQCCCKRCNDDKSNRDLSTYVEHIKENRGDYKYLSNNRIDYLYKLGLNFKKRGYRDEKNSLPA